MLWCITEKICYHKNLTHPHGTNNELPALMNKALTNDLFEITHSVSAAKAICGCGSVW